MQNFTKFSLGKSTSFSEGYLVSTDLAAVYDSIALAYDNNGQSNLSSGYYQKSADIQSQLGDHSKVAEVRYHQSIGHQRRQAWFPLEVSAEELLWVAQKAEEKGLQLEARRFLMLAHLNQNRPFKAMEHAGNAVLLSRELADKKRAVDEQTLNDLIQSLRPDVLQKGQANFLEPIVRAERISNSPMLAEDEGLLKKLRESQPVSKQDTTPLDRRFTSLEQVADELTNFATRHFGQPVQELREERRGIMRILGRGQRSVARRIWDIAIEDLETYGKNQAGEIMPTRMNRAILTFHIRPEQIVSIGLTEEECLVSVMEEKAIPGVNQSTYVQRSMTHLENNADLLIHHLNRLLLAGEFQRSQNR